MNRLLPHCRYVALLCMGLWLTGCATAPAPVPEDTWLQRKQQLLALEHWSATGKIALRNGQQAESANLSWQQQQSATTVQLSGPLGLQATQLHSDGRTLEVTQGETLRRFDLSSPDVMARETGWDLPLASLPYWLKGIPAPEPAPVTLDLADNLLQLLLQSGWQIRYERYQQVGAHVLPTRLTLERGATRAKVIIQHWQAGATP